FMDREILLILRRYDKILTYKGVSLVNIADYELRFTNPSGFMISSLFNFVRRIKLNLRTFFSKPNKDNKADILFLVYTHSHVNTLVPILNKLKEKYTVVKRDGFTDNVAKKLNKNNIKYNDLEGYLNIKSLFRIKNITKKTKRRLKELTKNRKQKPQMNYVLFEYFPDIVRMIEAVENMLSYEKPKLLVVMNEITTLGKISVYLAKRRGIKTVCIQHGGMGYDHESFIPVSVDKMAVWGNYSKNILIEEGTPEKKLAITGVPQFDKIVRKELTFNKDELKRIGVNSNKKVILLTTQPVKDMFDITRELCKTVKSMSKTQLVIKIHPSEYSIKKYKEIVKNEKVDAVITKDYLYPLISICEVLITNSSTTGIEAMIMGKRVITVNLTGEPDMLPYAEKNAAIGVYKKEDIKKALISVLFDDKTKENLDKKSEEFLYGQCYKMDGKASERVANFLKNMLKNKI
ncbi:MAG: UDP-N-acetylglucosamine 2-epimerase, partial [Candidatus Nanoarchaeia archaeon]|nr:UDP-N-acetylglucosamine 2-epimerase [Candidatus Nanoarchaeia archaeon]